MNTEQLLKLHEEVTAQCREIMRKKNYDYSGASGETPFKNFTSSATVLDIDPIKGLLIRALDKVRRMNTYLDSGKLMVEDEGFEDACMDNINYFILALAMMRERNEQANR